MSKYKINFNITGKNPKEELYKSCRKMIVGPWVNQVQHYQGYNGFVGWAGISKLKTGRFLMTFSSGYWHASPPVTPKLLEDKVIRDQVEKWQKIGMPNIIAPTGGRAHVMHSDDKGKTWSQPRVLVNTDKDDRHPTILELADGTLLCTFFDYCLPHNATAWFMKSIDQGETWSVPSKFPDGAAGFGNGSCFQLDNGKVLCAIGTDINNQDDCVNIYASDDSCESFYLYSLVKNVKSNQAGTMSESTICRLDESKYIIISRSKGAVCFSDDDCKTWSDPVVFGAGMFDPHFIKFPNGVLACFHGSYLNASGIRVMLSKDDGITWNGPKKNIGYCVDPSVYGYSHAMLLNDGSAYIVYLHTGGHREHDARTEAIWGLRVRPYDNADGIEILPAAGSPRDIGLLYSEFEGISFDGGDPELGNLE